MGLVEHFLRRIVRTTTKPIPPQIASKWKKRLHYVYLFTAWNFFFICGYKAYQARFKSLGQSTGEPGTLMLQFCKTSDPSNVRFFRVDGLNVTTTDYTRDDINQMLQNRENAKT